MPVQLDFLAAAGTTAYQNQTKEYKFEIVSRFFLRTLNGGYIKHKLIRNLEALRAALLATYFLLIVAGYYLLKPLSRSLFVTKLGSDNLPYVWIATTLVLSAVVPMFHWKVRAFHPQRILYLCTLSLILMLLLAWSLLPDYDSAALAFGFYVLIDVYSVIIIENFWSLTNANYVADSGKRYYGLIASGGLLGGMAGSSLTSFLVGGFKVSSFDLILYSVIVFFISLGVCSLLFFSGFVQDKLAKESHEAFSGRQLVLKLYQFPYLRYIVLILFIAQVIDPIVDYEFMKFVETEVETLSARTAYVSNVFFILSLLGLSVNFFLLPLLHRFWGVAGGLLLQPVSIFVCAALLLLQPAMLFAAMLKIADRGLSYSSGRASKEILYIPFETAEIFKIKAWIDVYGYRLFKIFASVLVIGITSVNLGDSYFLINSMVLILSLFWFKTLHSLTRLKEFQNKAEPNK